MSDESTYCPGTWPIDFFDRGQITRGEVACIRPKDHIGLCAARDPETGRQFQFPGRMPHSGKHA